MHNALDMLNVCIAPTRLCNLRCDHCYVAPELLADKSMMAESTYRQIFERIEELFKADKKVSKINIELLGGELTMMPLAFWEVNLPWTLARMAAWERDYEAEAALIWCTNLIFKDEGYVDLLNRMGEQYGDAFDLFVPWEPDTNRFKKDYKLLPRYLKTLESITGVQRKTLCVTMSKAVVEQGPEFLIDTFISRGITDVTCDMLYPAGSGKHYFQRTCTYGEVSDFLIKLRELLPAHIELSPLVEMESSSRTLTHYHYPGNDTYDIEVEPSGEVTFNSSFTGEESIFGSEEVLVSDKNFANKVIFNNAPELRLRHSMPYSECQDCEFAVVCSGGWAWHKNMNPELNAFINGGDCAGLKRVWEYVTKKAGIRQADRSEYLERIQRRQKQGRFMHERLSRIAAVESAGFLVESEYESDYEGFFARLAKPVLIDMKCGELFGKSWIERLFFYDAIGCQIQTDSGWYSRAMREGGEELFRHITYRNYHFLRFDTEMVAVAILANPQWRLSSLLTQILDATSEGAAMPLPIMHGRHDELFEFAHQANQIRREAGKHAS